MSGSWPSVASVPDAEEDEEEDEDEDGGAEGEEEEEDAGCRAIAAVA